MQSLLHRFEEGFIAWTMGIMVAVTFANVVARFSGSNILWALELTVFLFAWMSLIGAAYAVRVRSHLGVDAVVNVLGERARRRVSLFAVACCILYAFLLLKGSWDYWSVFADLPPTSGHWFPTGLADKFRSQSFYEVEDIPMLGIFSFLEGWINYGEAYEKMPKVVPYTILPIASALLLVRYIGSAADIARGRAELLIASHEAQDAAQDAPAPAAPAMTGARPGASKMPETSKIFER